MNGFAFENGEYVKDVITGLKGVVTGRANYITGCNQILVNTQRLDSDGAPVTGTWLDEHRLKRVGKARLVITGAADSSDKGSMEPAPAK